MMGRTEVTIGQFRQFMEATNHEIPKRPVSTRHPPEQSWESPGYAVTDESPVSLIAWRDMEAFCEWLSETEADSFSDSHSGTMVYGSYRLPTEAEWEYACRAGTTTAYWFGDDWKLLSQYAWYNRRTELRLVGVKPANPFGLFDMHGGVAELCYDSRRSYEGAVVDPVGSTTSSLHASRGGGWTSNAQTCRSAMRVSSALTYSSDSQGFRVARTLFLPATTP